MGKEEELSELHEEIRRCKKCRLYRTRANVVPGEGPENAKIMFIGLCPGATEDRIGRPFVGRAGKLLDELLQSIELKRNEVFITSVLKCRTPENRLPKSNEVKACDPYLQKQIEILSPRIIVLLGNTAVKTILNKKIGVNKIHGKVVRRDSVIYFPTFHPAAGIRSTRNNQKLFKDFKKLKKLILAKG